MQEQQPCRLQVILQVRECKHRQHVRGSWPLWTHKVLTKAGLQHNKSGFWENQTPAVDSIFCFVFNLIQSKWWPTQIIRDNTIFSVCVWFLVWCSSVVPVWCSYHDKLWTHSFHLGIIRGQTTIWKYNLCLFIVLFYSSKSSEVQAYWPLRSFICCNFTQWCCKIIFRCKVPLGAVGEPHSLTHRTTVIVLH